MKNRCALVAACALSVLTLSGCAYADRTATADNSRMMVTEDGTTVAVSSAKQPRPLYRWERELQENTAARSLIEESLYGRPPDANIDGFYQNYYSWY